ncbi:restriction endonuclease subunit S [Verrucomicrobiaceae bacterium R5-34]|nr:restriction endonuclease subunit S [Verrucomicrobiaceae bacterium R5-34]
MSNFKKYPAYKDSGVEWLGEIPDHWNCRRLAAIGRFSKGGGFSKASLVEKGVPAILYGDIYTKYETKVSSEIRYVSDEISTQSVMVQRGDILFTGSGETKEDIGKCVVLDLDKPACAGGDVIVYKQRQNNSFFLSYFLNIEPVKFEKAKTSKGEIIVHTYASKLRELSVSLPPPSEQAAIVNFLDDKTGKIDQAIAQKEELIALLKERKQIIIQNAVTKGLDPKVKMKDSGIEWLGEIPDHWEVSRSQNLFTQRKELARKGDQQLSATQAYGVILQKEYEKLVGRKVVKISMHLEKRKHVELNDFVISMRSFQGGLEVAWATGCIRSSYVVLKPSGKIDSGFYRYLLKTRRYIEALQSTANFIRDGQDLNFENFRQVSLPVIPLKEQQDIAIYLNQQMQKTDVAITQEQQAIEKLKEYKATLINSTVTGKIKVV